VADAGPSHGDFAEEGLEGIRSCPTALQAVAAFAVPLLEDQFVVGFFDEDLEETALEFDPDAMDRRLEVVGEMLILGRDGQDHLQSQFQREGLSLAVDGANVDANLEVVGIAHGESPYWNYGGSSCVFSSI
jgi:hypothetical protein